MTTKLGRAVVIVLVLLTSGALGACGSDDSEETNSTAETEPALDATAFRECILTGRPNKGDYGETDSPEPALAEASAEAEFFETVREDKGLVVFYVFDDAASAEDFAGELEAPLADVEKVVADFNDSAPVASVVDTQDSVVVGVIPFTPGKEGELSEEVASDVSICVEEQTGAS